MKDINVAQGIVTLSDFKANAASFLSELGQDNKPLVITQNGRPAAVVMSPITFEAMRERQRWLESIVQGVHDAEEGRVVAHDEVKQWLSSWGKNNEGQPPSYSSV